jgi:hypothetical protein
MEIAAPYNGIKFKVFETSNLQYIVCCEGWRWNTRTKGNIYSNILEKLFKGDTPVLDSPFGSTGGADKSLAQPGSKQARATEDFDFHISYL